jgi:hypothetical protein
MEEESMATSVQEFSCNHCSYRSGFLKAIRSHIRKNHFPEKIAFFRGTCVICNEKYQSLVGHFKSHFTSGFRCTNCSQLLPTKRAAFNHFRNEHLVPEKSGFTELQSAFNRNIQTFTRKFPDGRYETFDACFRGVKPSLFKLIRHQMMIKPGLQFSLIVFAQYVKTNDKNEVTEKCTFPLRSTRSGNILRGMRPSVVRRSCRALLHQMDQRHESIMHCGSGWTLSSITGLNVEVGTCRGMSSGDFVGRHNVNSGPYLKRAKKLGIRKCLTEVPSTANDCFFTAVAAGLIDDPPESCTASEAETLIIKCFMRTSFRWKSFENGMSVGEIQAFEKKNRALDFGVNLFSWDAAEETIFPLYQPKWMKKPPSRFVNIMLLSYVHPITERKTFHYMYINNLPSLFGNKTYPCELCLNVFRTTQALERHMVLCSKNSPQETIIPEEGDVIEFKNYKNQVLFPVFGTLDFEACMHDPKDHSDSGKTVHLKEQVPTTYSLFIRDIYGQTLFQETKSSDTDLLEQLFQTFHSIEKNIYPLLNRYPSVPSLSPRDEHAFQSATTCYLCSESFPSDDELKEMTESEANESKKCRDHCHYSNKFLGAAHNACNRKRKRGDLTIFVHNLKNYDSHFLMQGIHLTNARVSGIPLNTEKFKTLKIGCIQFVDSLQILPCSLAELVENLQRSEHSFPVVGEMAATPEEKDLLLRKGVFPYEWARSVSQMESATALPSIDAFFSTLRQESVPPSDYAHAQNVFSFFRCRNMRDYAELYCQLDTVLLFEVILAFQSIIMNTFGLDCTRYISTPQLAFDCMLKTLEEPIELMSNPDMILMCENNIRGGVSFVNERWVDLDQEEQDSNLLYVDFNNLYGFAQLQRLPIGEFEFCSSSEITRVSKDLPNLTADSDIGYILEVDLSYPENLHDLHSSFPLVAEQVTFTADDLSAYSRASVSTLRGSQALSSYKSSKLCTNLKNKKKYVTHYRCLQTYLRNGLKIDKIHRVIKFRQTDYVRKYIEICTALRASSRSAFEKYLYKLMSNSVYGKFLQNARNFSKAFICRREGIFLKHFNCAQYKSHKILQDDLAIVYKTLQKVKLNRPFATGFSILELAKDHMNQGFHEFIQPALGPENVSVVLTDTDSYVLHVRNTPRDEMFKKLSPLMDFSNFPPEHPYFSLQNKSRPGYLKDEHGGKKMREIVALRSKCYAIGMLENQKELITCKGITKVGKNRLCLDSYRDCIRDFKEIETSMYNIQSKGHIMHTQETRRIALSSSDDKRYLLPCGRHSLPHGHFRIKMNPQCTKCEMSLI